MTEQEKTYPGVPYAFQFVLPSYDIVARRFEAADGRLNSLLALASSLTVAAPVLARAVREQPDFASWWFAAAMLLYAAAVAVGLVGRAKGQLTVVDPGVHYAHWLHKSEWEFKKDAIYYAAVHFDDNARAVWVKGMFGLAVTGLLLLEVGALTLWLAR